MGPIRKRNKYGAIRTEVDNISFHSKDESERYLQLKLLEKAGEIHSLSLQPKIPLDVDGVHVANYFGDFSYTKKGETTMTVEEFKGFKTAVYKLKIKLAKALYGHKINFLETNKSILRKRK